MTDVNQMTEITDLRMRLEEAEETIRAIRSGAVDAFVVEVPDGARVYTLETADRPYRLLVEEMPQGALTLSDDGTIAYCNRRFADLVGRPLERLTGVAFRDFIPLDARTDYESLLQQGRAGCGQGESHVQHADGELIPVFLTLNALPPDCGAAVGLIVTDLTTQRHHEKLNALLEALKETDRRKNEFLAMLSHELRSPLAPITNALQLLGLEQANENPTQQQARGIIERQMGQLQHLIDDLLEVSRITTGRVQLHRERLVVSDIVHSAVETVQPLIEELRHELTVSLPSEPIWLYADAARLEQVLVNLLTNAAKYTDDGGRIWLTVERANGKASGGCQPPEIVGDHSLDGTPVGMLGGLTPPARLDEVIIRVRDTGVGISPALLPHIFELFTQAERSLDRSQGGLGIGLALVQRLTELHGGNVEAHSAFGQGSQFVVRLPMESDEWQVARGEQEKLGHTTPASHLSLAPRPSPLAPPLRVLVVDDNVDTAETLGMLLKATGHDVRTAHDGLAALEAAVDYRPNMMVLDIGLPGLNGYEVARRIRQEPTLKHTVLVALTGYGQELDRETSLEAGFDHHLVKPARFAQLQQILATVSVSGRALATGAMTSKQTLKSAASLPLIRPTTLEVVP